MSFMFNYSHNQISKKCRVLYSIPGRHFVSLGHRVANQGSTSQHRTSCSADTPAHNYNQSNVSKRNKVQNTLGCSTVT